MNKSAIVYGAAQVIPKRLQIKFLKAQRQTEKTFCFLRQVSFQPTRLMNLTLSPLAARQWDVNSLKIWNLSLCLKTANQSSKAKISLFSALTAGVAENG